MTSVVDFSSITVEVVPSANYTFTQCDNYLSEAAKQNMVSDMKVHMKQSYAIELRHSEKFAPIDKHGHLLNVCITQTVDVSTVKRWLMRFNSGAKMFVTRHITSAASRVHLRRNVSQCVTMSVNKLL